MVYGKEIGASVMPWAVHAFGGLRKQPLQKAQKYNQQR
jgi:hypothetical protein